MDVVFAELLLLGKPHRNETLRYKSQEFVRHRVYLFLFRP